MSPVRGELKGRTQSRTSRFKSLGGMLYDGRRVVAEVKLGASEARAMVASKGLTGPRGTVQPARG